MSILSVMIKNTNKFGDTSMKTRSNGCRIAITASLTDRYSINSSPRY